DVERVLVGLVLGAGRRPERPLPGGAGRLQLLPALRGHRLLVELPGLLGVGHRDLAEQRLRLRRADLLQLLVGGAVDPADEEAGHRVYSTQWLAAGDALFQ